MPAWIGIPGSIRLRRLLSIAARIGVGQSLGFSSKNPGLAGRLIRPGGYTPDALVVGLADALIDPAAGIAGFHIYTFNEIVATEHWRHEMLEQLSAGP